MKVVYNYLVRKPTFISVITALFFVYIAFLIVYRVFNPPKIGSAYNMVLEMLMIFSFIPLGLFIIDRQLVTKIHHIRLTIIELIICLGIFLLIYFS